jgi:hypothetical protein
MKAPCHGVAWKLNEHIKRVIVPDLLMVFISLSDTVLEASAGNGTVR